MNIFRNTILLAALCLFSSELLGADKVAEQIMKTYQDSSDKLKKTTVEKLKVRQEAVKKSGDDKSAEEIQSMISELEGDKDASTAGDENAEKQDNTQPDGWISKNATYTISSTYMAPKPSFLTCDEEIPSAFETEPKATTGINGWCKVDLGKVYEIKRIEVKNRADAMQGRIVGAEISLSTDGKKWQKIGVFKKADPEYVFTVKNNKKAQFIKIEQTNGDNLHLKTMKVFGK